MAGAQQQDALLSISTRPAPGRGRAAVRGVWSPLTTLAYCWRSQTLLGLGGWHAVSPWDPCTPPEDRHSAESALITGVLLAWAA